MGSSNSHNENLARKYLKCIENQDREELRKLIHPKYNNDQYSNWLYPDRESGVEPFLDRVISSNLVTSKRRIEILNLLSKKDEVIVEFITYWSKGFMQSGFELKDGFKELGYHNFKIKDNKIIGNRYIRDQMPFFIKLGYSTNMPQTENDYVNLLKHMKLVE